MIDLKAEPEAMDGIASQVDAEATAVGDVVERLSAGTRALGMGWTGAAHDAFAGTYSRWEQDMTTQRDALSAAADAVRKAAAAYDEADRRVAGIWSL